MHGVPNSKVGSTPSEVVRFGASKAPIPYMIPPTQRPQTRRRRLRGVPAAREAARGGERARGRSEAEQQGPEDSRKFWGRGGAAAAAAGPGLRRPAVGGRRRETPEDKGSPQRLRGLTWRQERPERLPAVRTLLLPRAAQLSGRGSPLALL